MKKLGTMCYDYATRLEGMITHLQIEMDQSRYYLFQPKGLNPKTGQPVDTIWLVATRLSGGEEVEDDPDWPLQVLGTKVKDSASGFEGIATSMQVHINGCVHFNVQPEGLQETGSAIASCNFDVRRLIGEKVPKLTEAEEIVSNKRNPSPAPCGVYRPTAG